MDPLAHERAISRELKKREGEGLLGGSVEHPNLDFGSGHDPNVVGSSPTSGSSLSMEPA